MIRKYDPSAVLAFIIAYKRTHDGCPPTYRQIMAELGIRSLSNVRYILVSLQEQGLLTIAGTELHVTGGKWTIDERSQE